MASPRAGFSKHLLARRLTSCDPIRVDSQLSSSLQRRCWPKIDTTSQQYSVPASSIGSHRSFSILSKYSSINNTSIHRRKVTSKRPFSLSSSISSNQASDAPPPSNDQVSDSLRLLMRHSAQPVAIITAHLPSSSSSSAVKIHGATLSSFTTISLSPIPLVTFSLKLPSRMSDLLSAKRDRFVINLLSENQGHLAAAFSKPGLEPFYWRANGAPAKAEGVHPLEKEQSEGKLVGSRHAIVGNQNTDHIVGVPLLKDSLGCLTCSIQGWVDLNQLETAQSQENGTINTLQSDSGNGSEEGSRLFIARVHAIEKSEEMEQDRKPLVYWNRTFTSVK